MGQKQAAYDFNNLVIAFYDTVDSPAPYGTNVINITDAQWQNAINTGGQWQVSGSDLLAYVVTPTLAELTQRYAGQIDAAVADIYATFTRFQQEYLNREAAAQAFKTAGYVGDPGLYVTGYATAAGVTNQVAADTILAQAAMLNGALASLGALRMRKYEVLAAANAAAAASTLADIMSKIQAIAAGLS